jgi:alkylhydroperoxidase family enzyme
VAVSETKYDELISRLRAAVPASVETSPELAAYLEKVRRAAYEVTDEDVRTLLDAGHSEDEIFEQTVAVAVAVGLARRDAALGALG